MAKGLPFIFFEKKSQKAFYIQLFSLTLQHKLENNIINFNSI